MTFKQRLKFYLIGFVMGLLVLMSVLNKRGCKGINTLKSEELSYQTWQINDAMRCKLTCIGFTNDSLFLQDVKTCNVNYAESDVHAEPCGKYVLESSDKSVASYTLLVTDCGTITKLLDVKTKTSCNCK